MYVSETCRQKFSPLKLKADKPNYNTQAGEQTLNFVWVGRYRHILCSMNKVHQFIYYLHCMVRRKNSYSAKCYRNGRKPLLPKKNGNGRWPFRQLPTWTYAITIQDCCLTSYVLCYGIINDYFDFNFNQLPSHRYYQPVPVECSRAAYIYPTLQPPPPPMPKYTQR